MIEAATCVLRSSLASEATGEAMAFLTIPFLENILNLHLHRLAPTSNHSRLRSYGIDRAPRDLCKVKHASPENISCLSGCRNVSPVHAMAPRTIDSAQQPSHRECYLSIDPLAHPTVLDRKSTRLNSSHSGESRMPSSA